MKKGFKFGLGAFAGLVSAAVLSVGAMAAGSLNGAGGTAIYPVLSQWAKDYQQKTGTAVNYQAIGSGGGIAQITAKTVDFGNSDKPLVHADLQAKGLVQFPEVIITIVPVLHLPGIKSGQLVIDGPTLADIYLGKIKKWNDPALKKLNPNAPLPNMAILVVHRSDGSGTTFNFTNYLSKVSPEWKEKVGSDTSVNWPMGVGGKGNAGVAASVEQTIGSIGYVEYAYLMSPEAQGKITYMDMINSDGKRVVPNMSTFQSAAAHADFSKVQDFYLILTDQPGENSWPIVAATYMLMRPDYGAEKNKEVLKFLDYGLTDGTAASEKLDYIPFPEAVVKQIEASWKTTLGVTLP